MANYSAAEPGSSVNESALEVTQLHLQQAIEIAKQAGKGSDLVPALLVALALNRQTVQQHRDKD